eukprot:g19161.t1
MTTDSRLKLVEAQLYRYELYAASLQAENARLKRDAAEREYTKMRKSLRDPTIVSAVLRERDSLTLSPKLKSRRRAMLNSKLEMSPEAQSLTEAAQPSAQPPSSPQSTVSSPQSTVSSPQSTVSSPQSTVSPNTTPGKPPSPPVSSDKTHGKPPTPSVSSDKTNESKTAPAPNKDEPYTCKSKTAPAPNKDEPYTCKVCKWNNPGRARFCQSCSTPRGDDHKPKIAAVVQVKAKARLLIKHKRAQSPTDGRNAQIKHKSPPASPSPAAAPRSLQSIQQTRISSSDWDCPNCKFRNPQRSKFCQSCAKPHMNLHVDCYVSHLKHAGQLRG